jgi:O-methyltransferase involved in polyketide biosynthesis
MAAGDRLGIRPRGDTPGPLHAAQRAALFDCWARAFIERCSAQGERCEIGSIGCGFDARWAELEPGNGTVARCVELDQAELLAHKADWFSRSPFADAYARVQALGLHLARDLLPAALGSTRAPVLVIAEGVLDYLPEAARLHLFAQLRGRAPRAEFLLDGQNSWASARNNRHAARATGNAQVLFAATPPHPQSFYRDRCGLIARECVLAVPELLRRKHPWLSRLPRPRPRRTVEAYQLLWLAA